MTSKFAIMRDEHRRACEGPSLFLPLAARPSVLGALLGGWGCWPSSRLPRRVCHLVGDCYIHLRRERVWGSEGVQGWGGCPGMSPGNLLYLLWGCTVSANPESPPLRSTDKEMAWRGGLQSPGNVTPVSGRNFGVQTQAFLPNPGSQTLPSS